MQRIISLPDIISELVQVCGCTSEVAAEFLHAFAEVVADGIAADGVVKIKGIGVFRKIEVAEGYKLEFQPDSILADEVNAPFALFEPVELSDGISEDAFDDEPQEAGDSQDAEASPDEDNSREMEDSPGEEDADNDAEPSEEYELEEEEHEHSSVINNNPPIGIPPIPSRERDASGHGMDEVGHDKSEAGIDSDKGRLERETDRDSDRVLLPETVVRVERKSHISTLVLVALISLIAGLLAGYFGFPWINLHEVKNVKITADNVRVVHETAVNNEAPVAVDSVENPLETSVPKDTSVSVNSKVQASATATEGLRKNDVVTDTVSGKNYLSRIARRHYGKDIFWVYIYEENHDVISDPNNVRPGTIVTIPPAEKYNIDPKNPESIHEAERRSARILASAGGSY